MSRYEPRDRSGPMDIDNHDPIDRLSQFALHDPEQGPSRKHILAGLHSDTETPSRAFHPNSTSSRPLHFGQDTPFIFHLSPSASSALREVSFKPYNPSEWASATFGFAQPASRSLEDVEMRNGDSPAKHQDVQKEKGKVQSVGKEAEDGSMETRPMASGAVARVRRKRQKEWKKGRNRSSGSEGDGENQDKARKRMTDPLSRSVQPNRSSKSEHHYSFHMPAPALRHSEIPSILLGYLQFFVNASVVIVVLYLAVQFVLTVRRDLKDRMQEVSVEILQEIAECTNLYLRNRCDPTLRVPAMEAPCKTWEICMQRDPTMVGRTNVMAETFAGVINSFVDPISWKTMGFTLVTLSFLIILTNSALWNLRAKAHREPLQPVYTPASLPQLTQNSIMPMLSGAGAPQASRIGWEGGKPEWL
ncbi:MAG: hypothetical protein TREMPRED_001171 [Tremellales sp. Tagirdzhanova-0007]|nr:MAG: hypothetical protein TREMPRED_001171 [Tremellales sp. Tagirdzhanova-0007]